MNDLLPTIARTRRLCTIVCALSLSTFVSLYQVTHPSSCSWPLTTVKSSTKYTFGVEKIMRLICNLA
jgi:hypothetical protein